MREPPPLFSTQPRQHQLLWAVANVNKPYTKPSRHYSGDAGLDLYTSERTIVWPGKFAMVPTNIQVALPHGTWCMLTGRSSTRNRGLAVMNGIIDNGYRGELFSTVLNTTEDALAIEVGERLVQLIVFNLMTPELVETPVLPDGERGDKGFGSTGV
jgi:dUTP pyrophosphatase